LNKMEIGTKKTFFFHSYLWLPFRAYILHLGKVKKKEMRKRRRTNNRDCTKNNRHIVYNNK
jgi:hypothetical protein